MTAGALVKRSFALAGHRTSVALEAAFWAELADSAVVADTTLLRLVAEVDAARAPAQSLASALRLHALAHAQTKHPHPNGPLTKHPLTKHPLTKLGER